MRANVWFAVLVVLCAGGFVGIQFLFSHLSALCEHSAPGYNASHPASSCGSNATRFDCAIGWIGVSTSVVAFGSFALPVKAPQVLSADVGPVVFQMYMSTAVFLTSFLVLVTTPWSFTWWGVLSASLWVPTSLLSLVAIKFIGISVGQAMWAGATVVVSFVWGVAMFSETPQSLGLALLGIGLILLGIVGLSLCNTEYFKALEARRTGATSTDTQALLLQNPESSGAADDSKPAKPQMAPGRRLLIGILAAMGVGLTNGSMLVPAKFAARADPNCEFSGMGFIVSFGIGVMLVTTVIAIGYHLIMRQLPVFKPSQMLVPAFATGLLWSIGNLGSIFAAQYLGLAVGFALTQTCLVVAGIWGLVLLRELRGLIPISIWGVSALVLLGGAVLLSLFG